MMKGIYRLIKSSFMWFIQKVIQDQKISVGGREQGSRKHHDCSIPGKVCGVKQEGEEMYLLGDQSPEEEGGERLATDSWTEDIIGDTLEGELVLGYTFMGTEK
jgi:hypothetical protein